MKSGSGGVEIALLENGKLVEFHEAKKNDKFKVGDIFLGRVKKINPGLNAAFVDIGYQKDAFLHYTDLGPNVKSLIKWTNLGISGSRKHRQIEKAPLEKEIVKTGKINNVLSKKHPLMVQVFKEPISTKGPRLTSEITIPGRYLVLAPFSNTIGISKKIEDAKERKRLQKLIESIRPNNFGVVVRTVAQGKSVADLHEDLMSLVDKWYEIYDKLHNVSPPVQLLSEINKTSGLLRDFLNESYSKITIDDKKLAQEVKSYIAQISPGKEKIVSYHGSKTPIFDAYGVTRQIKSAFGKSVTMDSGAYLVIEHTEALHVVDVNSGYRVNNSTDQETNALQVNLEAAEEVARQLRLRDIGGIIIIDFIDMKSPANKRKVYQTLKDAMEPDHARHSILPMSKFGLIQITRERVRPEVKIATVETCPTCRGSGKIEPSVLIIDEIEREIEHLTQEMKLKNIKLIVHPFVEAFLKKGLKSKTVQWLLKYGTRIKVAGNADFGIVEYHIYDSHGEEISLDKSKKK